MPCQRKLPSTTRRLQNITRTLRTITVKRPSTTTPDTMRRPHTTPTRREDTQLTPCITAKKRRRLTPRSTERNKGFGARFTFPDRLLAPEWTWRLAWPTHLGDRGFRCFT